MHKQSSYSTDPIYWYAATDKKTPLPKELIQLARTGRFYREDHGGVFRVTKMQLLQMRDNALDRNVDIPLKYTHSGEVYAAGWMSPESLSVQPIPGGYGLFGKPRWTTEALQKITEGALKYISPEIVWKDKRLADSKYGAAGEEIGATLVGAALVLSPFFDMLPVSSFSRKQTNARGEDKKMYDKMLALSSAEKMAEVSTMLQEAGVSETQASGVAAKLLLMMIRSVCEAEHMPEVEIELEMPETEETEQAMAESSETEVKEEEVKEEEVKEEEVKEETMQAGMAPMQQMARAFGLKPSATAKSIVAAAEAQRKMYSAMQQRLSALETQETQRQKAAAESLFQKYEAEGRFRFCASPSDPSGVDAAKNVLAKGVDVFESVFGNVQPLAAAFSKAPAAPKISSKKTEGGVPSVEQVKQYQAKHNLNYGEALKALLVGKE